MTFAVDWALKANYLSMSLLLLPRSPHSDVHTSLLDEGSSFPEILWAAVELCLQGCDCWPCPCSQVVEVRACLEDMVWSETKGSFAHGSRLIFLADFKPTSCWRSQTGSCAWCGSCSAPWSRRFARSITTRHWTSWCLVSSLRCSPVSREVMPPCRPRWSATWITSHYRMMWWCVDLFVFIEKV